MKVDLLATLHRVTRKLTFLPLFFLFSIFQPCPAVAQGNCAMEQHIVDSWTATVEGDQKDIAKIQQKQGETGSPELTELLNKLQKDTQRLQNTETRLADCQKHANGGAPA